MHLMTFLIEKFNEIYINKKKNIQTK
jgi:hypothetical protein